MQRALAGFLLVTACVTIESLPAGAQVPPPTPMPTYSGHVVTVTPQSGLQAALDVAQPGDVLSLAPGVYYESVVVTRSGTAAAPIVITAKDPGSVTISGATPPDFTLSFTRVQGDLYRASVPWTVRWVMVDGRNLIGYDDLDGLESFTILGHDSGKVVSGPPEGFTWVGGTLYLRLLGGQNPSQAKIEIHRSFAGADSPPRNTDFFGDHAFSTTAGNLSANDPAGTNITVRGSHIIIAGLKLHLAPLSAVTVAADDVIVRDCYVDGVWRAVRAGGSARVTVEYSEFSGYPTYQWVRWGSLSGKTKQQELWNAIYNSNLNITPISHYGPDFRLDHSLIYECFDCLWPRNMNSLDPADTSEYSANLVMSCGDDCIEFDTKKPINLRVHHNFLMDGTTVLALSPVQGGGLMIDHNIAYDSSEYGLFSSTLFKFDCPWCTTGSDPTQLVTIAHNTLVSATGGLYWTGEDHTYRNDIFEDNIVYTRRETGWVNPEFTMSPYNLHSGPRMDPNAQNMAQTIPAADPDFRSAPLMELGALKGGARVTLPVLPLQTAPPTTDAPMVDFRLQPDGVSVDAGNPMPYLDAAYHHTRKGLWPDLGAIELGQDFQLSAGPRWAVGAKKPSRPAPPPSLDPAMLGLETPVPEPSFGAMCVFGVLGLSQLACRRQGRRLAGLDRSADPIAT